MLAESNGALLAAHTADGVHRSTDGGTTWQQVLEADVLVTTLGAEGGVAWVAAGSTLYTSDDGGASWTAAVDEGIDLQTVGRAADGTWILGSERLLYRYTDTFEPADELPGVHGLRYIVRADDVVIALHRDGTFRSTDHGATWTPRTDGLEVLDLGPLLTHPRCPSLVWVGTQCERGAFESVDGWGDGLRYIDEYLHYVMVMQVRDRDIWVTTDNVLKRSQDLGITWETIAPDVIDVHSHGLALHPTDEGIVLVGTVGSGEVDDGDTTGRILRTTDAGETWEVATGLPENEASVHALHFVDDQVALAGTYAGGDYVHKNGEPGIGILRSEDAGASWTELEGSAASVPVFDQCGDRVYAASDEGVLASDDAGLTWTNLLSSGTQFASVSCYGDVVLGLDQGTVWRSDDAGESWSDWGGGLSPEVWQEGEMPQVSINADGTLAYVAIAFEGLLRRPLGAPDAR